MRARPRRCWCTRANASGSPRLRAVATSVDPALQLHQVRLAERSTLDILLTYQFWVRIAYIGCGIVLLLSILGIYSILSFTVARRTREIGIRVALGASRWGVLRPIFVQTFTQVGLGTVGGILLPVLLTGGIHSARGLALLAAGAGLMALATAAAGFLPTRRALGVQPIEAMRSDG